MTTGICMSPQPRVLVADDQTDILQALRLLLGDAGFDTDLVTSIDEVVRRVSDAPYDLLLMDLNYTRDTTSGREGLEPLERVRARDAALPVVVMTGWGSIETAVEAMRRGAKSFVQKPWDDMTLVQVVRREVDDGQALRRRDASRAREHEEARLIQQALLPATMPDIRGVSLAARWTPRIRYRRRLLRRHQVFPTRVAVSIADVVGKDCPGALVEPSGRRARVRHGRRGTERRVRQRQPSALPQHRIGEVRHVLLRRRGHRRARRRLRQCRPQSPVLMHADGRIDRLSPTGWCSVSPTNGPCTTGSVETEPGDHLVWFTDGITEALAPDGEGVRRRSHHRDPATASRRIRQCLVRTLSDAVSAWTETGPQDDATLIVAEMH